MFVFVCVRMVCVFVRVCVCLCVEGGVIFNRRMIYKNLLTVFQSVIKKLCH